MNKRFLFATVSALLVLPLFADDHEKIEKVMNDGLKGKTSPMAKVIGGNATPEETKALAELVKSMHGTKAPVGEQAAYEAKVGELIAAMDAVAGGEKSEVALGRLEKAQNCKACHTDHKPK